MSRFYRVEIEIKPVEEGEEDKILSVFNDYGIEKGNTFRSDGVFSITGDITLAGGKSEKEKHDEWKKDRALEGKLLFTRWLCWDFIDWHETIMDEDW